MVVDSPVVRVFLACREIITEPDSGDVTLLRLIHAVRPLPGERFPIRQERLALFGLMSSGRGKQQISVEFTRFEKGQEVVLASPPARIVDFGQDPVVVLGLPMELENVVFESPGQYSFHLVCNGHRIATTDIWVREEQ